MRKTDRTVHPLQSDAWAQFRSAMGTDIARTREGWYVSFHSIPCTTWTIGYFPKGPIVTRTLLRELQELGLQKRAIFILLEPYVVADIQTIKPWPGLRPSHRPLFTKYTYILDLTKSEDDLLGAMHPKTRYNIRLAQRHGVYVGENNSDEAFEAYLALTKDTTKRQKFYAHNEAYHRTMWKFMRKSGIAHLFTATYRKEILAAWIIFVMGDTLYYPYGASSVSYREVMAPTLMLWEIVRWAKKRNMKYFDLWGSLGPNPDPSDPWYGFHRFKSGFAPTRVEYIDSYDLVLKPFWYRVYILADTIRWTWLNLLRR